MKKILLFAFLLFAGGLFAQTPYDTVNVRDPQNFVEMTTIDTAYGQIISRKANLNRRIGLQTLKDWILTGVDGIDTVYWSGDTLNILQGLTLWQAVADDNSGLFDAANNGDTIRATSAYFTELELTHANEDAQFSLSDGLFSVLVESQENIAGDRSMISLDTFGRALIGVQLPTNETWLGWDNNIGDSLGLLVQIDGAYPAENDILIAGADSLFRFKALDSLGLSGDNIYTADGTLTGNRFINSDGYLLLNNGGFFAIADSAWYAAQGILGEIPSGVIYGISNVGLTSPYQIFPGVNAISSQFEYSTATSYYDETFYAALVAKDGADSSQVIVGDADIRLYADTLDATGVTTFLGFPSGGAIDSISYYGDTLRIYEGGDLTPFKAEIVAGADTDDQTLSTSRDTITIADGNSVRTPGVGFLRDSITGATKTLDLKKYSQAIYVIKMESATSVTLTINNPWSEVSGSYPTQEGETGVYTFRFAGISGTDNVTWPANFYDMGGTALGTDALTAGTAYTCFYDPVEAKYYCK